MVLWFITEVSIFADGPLRAETCNDIEYGIKGKGKAVPLHFWSGPEGSGKLRFPDYMTTAQDGA